MGCEENSILVHRGIGLFAFGVWKWEMNNEVGFCNVGWLQCEQAG